MYDFVSIFVKCMILPQFLSIKNMVNGAGLALICKLYLVSIHLKLND